MDTRRLTQGATSRTRRLVWFWPRVERRPSAPLWGPCLLMLVAGCVEPRFNDRVSPDASQSDAGIANDSSRPGDAAVLGPEDASAAADGDAAADNDAAADASGADPSAETDGGVAAIPAWGRPLLGRYAVRSEYFAQDGASKSSGQEIALVEISEVDGRAQLQSQICSWMTGLPTAFGPQEMRVTAPTQLPPRVLQVTFANGGFEANGPAVRTGYAAVSPPACSGVRGQSVPGQASQSWLGGGSCSCPLSDDTLPYADDCRVTDSDGDHNPGLSVTATGPATGYFHVATNISVRYVGGAIDPDGKHTAHEARVEHVSVVGCAATLPCTLGAASCCLPAFNTVRFERLPARAVSEPSWNCAAVMAAFTGGELLVYAQPPYPSENCLLDSSSP